MVMFTGPRAGAETTAALPAAGRSSKSHPAGRRPRCTAFALKPSALTAGNLTRRCPDSNFYGTTYAGGTSTICDYGCGSIFKITPSGILTTIYSFCSRSGCSDGQLPGAGLLQAPNGNLLRDHLRGRDQQLRYGLPSDPSARMYGLPKHRVKRTESTWLISRRSVLVAATWWSSSTARVGRYMAR
jgi:uncharacterized repeat protein (TIGR03803 family)